MKDIILLHGAIGSKEQLQPLANTLATAFNVHLFNLPGHGGSECDASEFSIEYFADVVFHYLEEHTIEKASFFGYSMGGYIAMLLAKKYPQRVEKIITLATKFYWDEAVAAKEISLLQPGTIEEKIPAFAKELAKRHSPADWKELLLQTQTLLAGLGKQNKLSLDDYKEILHPCLLMLGDRDKMVGLPETMDVFKQLPNGALAVLPQTSHPVEKADPLLLKMYIDRFLNG